MRRKMAQEFDRDDLAITLRVLRSLRDALRATA
jgi:hypothetical protein